MLHSLVLLVAIVILIVIRLYKFCFDRPPNFPPGPPRIPLFGSYLFLKLVNDENKHLAFNWFCKYYKSSVIGFYLGDKLAIYANDPKSVREILNRQEFDGRPDVLLARLRDPKFDLKGIFFIEGDTWLHQRRFALRNLRDFGFGRRFPDFENEVLDEMKNLVNLIKEGPKFEHEKKFFKCDGSVLFPHALIGSMGNCFLQVCFNERFSRADQHKIFTAGEGSFSLQKDSNEFGNIFSVIPWIRFFFPDQSAYSQCRKGSMKMSDFIDEILKRQLETYQEGHARSFLDLYIEQMKSAETEGVKTDFLYEQILMICTDFLFPSLSAMETQIAFILRLLVHNKKCLKKVQDEIESVVGSGRFVELDDRVNLPYLESCLREGLRIETLVPSSVVHKALEDTKLMGYDIPKETSAYPGLNALHFDKETWGDPENFRPERFIENGKFSVKLDKSLPFGAGRRLCAGETFARNTMFLALAAILQNFNLKPSDSERNGKFPELNANSCGLVRTPNDYWLKLEAK